MFRHEFAFDPTYGYSQDQLLAIRAPEDSPIDFASFWQATFDENASQPLGITRRCIDSPSTEHGLFEVSFQTWCNLRVGAWLVLPRDRRITCGAVIGHGYGGRAAPDFNGHPAACLFPCMPGFDLSQSPGIPSVAGEHVLHAIASRDTYILRACVATIWTAVTVLKELCPEVGEHIYYLGGSFGGGLGALALPWDRRIKRAFLDVPTFGHHPIRLQCPCTGSGQAVRLHARGHPEVIHVLRYYDAATATTHIRVPVLAAPALFDPAVPPPGQFAVANNLAGPKHLFIHRAGHFDHPGAPIEQQALNQTIDEIIWKGCL